MNDSYAVFHFTSHANPYLDPSEIEEMRGEMSPNQFFQEVMAEYRKMQGLVYESFSREMHVVPRPFTPARWGLSIDFGYNHPLWLRIVSPLPGGKVSVTYYDFG